MTEDFAIKDDVMDAPKPKSRGLGRGLNALFEDEENFASGFDTAESDSAPSSGRKRETVGVEQLYPGGSQPRHVFDEDALDQLADSIKQHGLLQPLLVRRASDGVHTYEIIAGERRWRAAQRAQLHEVPVIVLDLDDVQALEIALIENLQREDLNPIDEAMGYQRLMNDYGHTQEKLAEALGKSRSHIANMVRLLNLPMAVQEMVADNNLSMGHARALITAKDPAALAKIVVEQGLSVRETERLAADHGDTPKKAKSKAKSGKDADTIALEREVSNVIGMAVKIDSKNGKSGKISIQFKTLDQLDDVLQRLSHISEGRLSQ
ncbi:MAG: ParB/RepB/Spo0J family partition protein [Bdellovibrionales bacterium]